MADGDVTKRCVDCGSEFAPNHGRRVRCFDCSPSTEKPSRRVRCVDCGEDVVTKRAASVRCACCRDARRKGHVPLNLQTRECGDCGQGFTPFSPAQKRCDDCRHITGETIACGGCGSEFVSNYKTQSGRKRQFCSRLCQVRSYAKSKAEDHRRAVLNSASLVRWVHCKGCGRLRGTDVTKRSAVCGSCHGVYAAAHTWCRENGIDLSLRAYKKAIGPRACCDCGDTYTPTTASKLNRCTPCAKRRNARIAKLKRKATIRRNTVKLENIDPFDVLKMDGWVCYICGKDTPRKHRGTVRHNAPEVDHIIPVSQGGEHRMANMACACRECNNAKSDQFLFHGFSLIRGRDDLVRPGVYYFAPCDVGEKGGVVSFQATPKKPIPLEQMGII